MPGSFRQNPSRLAPGPAAGDASATTNQEPSRAPHTGATRDSAQTRSVVLGTAGHIDHGKTALVLALTGIDADRLPEEKARGITIDLGFASLDLTDAQGQRFEISLIDVPGHQAFIRNMLAGAGGIDAVMLVVAADEGVKAQTREHLQICRLLGIQHGLVVLTKADAVRPERLAAARAEVAELVDGSFLQNAPVLPASALTGEGISELNTALLQVFAAIPARSNASVARLPVDRVFSVRGFGTVATGTLQSGAVRTGETQVLQPANRRVRVRGVQVHGKARNQATAPNRVALNLAGVEISDVQRGDTLVPENTLEPITSVDAEVEVLGLALRHRQRVRLHAFASDCLATVLLYREEGAPASTGLLTVRLRLARPMLLVPGDRFVLRRPSPAETLGGGRVLDAHPLARQRKVTTACWLNSIRTAFATDAIALRIQRQGVRGLTLQALVAQTGFTRDFIMQLVLPRMDAGSIVADVGKELFVAADALEAAEEAVLQEIRRTPEEGILRAELRSRLRLPDWIFSKALARLTSVKAVTADGDRVSSARTAKSSVAQSHGTSRAAEVERVYRTAGLASPLVSQVGERLGMAAPELRTVITTLLRAGTLVRLGSDALLIHHEALEALVARLQAYRGQALDVRRFKTLTALTRKHAIPLLEYLDGARVTRHAGGVRVVL